MCSYGKWYAKKTPTQNDRQTPTTTYPLHLQPKCEKTVNNPDALCLAVSLLIFKSIRVKNNKKSIPRYLYLKT